jgi:hypothetical protein
MHGYSLMQELERARHADFVRAARRAELRDNARRPRRSRLRLSLPWR